MGPMVPQYRSLPGNEVGPHFGRAACCQVHMDDVNLLSTRNGDGNYHVLHILHTLVSIVAIVVKTFKARITQN